MIENETYEKLKIKVLEQESIIDQLGPIFDFSLDLIGSGNLQGFFTKVNPSFERLLGYPEEEFLQFPFLDFVHPDDFQDTKHALEAAAGGEREIHIANRYRCKDGSHKWIDWRVQAFTKKNLFIAVGRDITREKELKNDLYQSERRYQNIIQTTNDGFLVVDENGKIQDCNTAYLNMSGFNRDELLAKTISDIDALDTQKDIEDHLEALIEKGCGRFETAHVRKDGSSYPVEVRTSFIPQEKLFVSFVKDITERKQTHATLQESEERFRQLAENIGEVFWLGSVDWQAIYYISPAYEKIWGKPRASLYNNPLSWLDYVHEGDKDKIRESIPEKIDASTQVIVFPEYRICNEKGDIRWIQARAFPVINASGEIYRIAGIAEDITERKLAELERTRLVKELQKAMKEIKTLKGFLPVCASCKMIRDEKGKWLSFENYIEEHSDVEITHSICPVCAMKLYPNMFDKEGKIKKD